MNINVGTELILYSSAVLPSTSTSILTNVTVGWALLNLSKNGAILLLMIIIINMMINVIIDMILIIPRRTPIMKSQYISNYSYINEDNSTNHVAVK